MARTLATVGIISIGDMGIGIAKLLAANKYNVVTNVTGRSQDTVDRAKAASVTCLPNDAEVALQSDYIFSIVPPRDAIATAKRFSNLTDMLSRRTQPHVLYYLDMNAVSPSTGKQISSLFANTPVHFIDGGIIGGPPKITDPAKDAWYKPSLVFSGPHSLASAPVSGAHLAELLNYKHVANTIGPGSGLKMCFASMSKGMVALCIQAFTTAHTLGVLPELQSHLQHYNPKAAETAEKGLVGMGPKAYRWVAEMQEIGHTFQEEAGWGGELFEGVSDVYKAVAEETVVGKEKIGQRKLGTDAGEVARLIVEGMGEARGKGKGNADGIQTANVEGI